MQDILAQALTVYMRYAAWMREAPAGLGGTLILTRAEGPGDGVASPLELTRAANIAGAASLVVGADLLMGRAAVRSGVCDFLVTGLDEALRILKNELRQRHQVAVYLALAYEEIREQCIARGVQPQWLGDPEPTLEARGARPAPAADPGSAEQLAAWAVQAPTAPILAQLDQLAITACADRLTASGRRWLARSPQYLARELARMHTLPMVEKESMLFSELLRQAVQTGQLPPDTNAWWGSRHLLSLD